MTNAKGKLTKVTSSISTTEYTNFDILGRVTGHKQTTTGGASGGYATSYAYNLAGALIEETYPSGRVVKNELDASGDLAVVKSKKNATSGPYHDYAFNFVYNAAGAVTSMQLGNNRYESTLFNSRLQPYEIRLGTGPSSAAAYDLLRLEYGYGTTANNGNVLSQTITVPTVGASTGFSAVQNYTYDSLNRIKDATELITPSGGSQTQSWKQTYTFDRYGNRRFDFTGGNTTFPASSCTEAICNPTISTSNNRITSSGWTYDAAGNTLTDANGQSYIYDGENKQVKASNGSGLLGEYWYDGDGKRVKKYVPPSGTDPGETTIFVYDAAGKLIGEYSTVVAAAEDARVAYLTADHLGSPRINTDRDGKVTSRHDYHPYGEEIITAQRTSHDEYTPDSVRKQFTGYERDAEVGLDFAEARMFNGRHGRFTAADPLMASARTQQPQSWNRYSYVWNNPLGLVDPDGTDVKLADKKAEERLLSTLPEKLRKEVQKLIKNGMLKSGSLKKIKSDNGNFLDLKTLVDSKKVVSLSVGSSGGGQSFYYSVTTAAEQASAARDSMRKEGIPENEIDDRINEERDGRPFTDIMDKSDGFTEVDSNGNVSVTVSDGKGANANEPQSELAEGTAHELYVHAVAAVQGKPWKHEVDPKTKEPLPAGPQAPINQKTVDVRARTYQMYRKP